VAMQPGEGGAMGAHPIRPARFWYWVAGAAVVAAVLWLAFTLFLGFRSLSRQVEGFQRVPIPGQAEVTFAEPGGYTVYFEGLGASDDQVALPPFRFSLTTVGGEEVTIRPYGGSATYGLAGHSGRAVATFQIEEPGRFLLQTEGEPQGGQASLAVGRSVGPGIFGVVSLAIVGALVLFLAGAALAVVVAVRPNRARRPLPAAAAQPVSSWRQGAVAAGWFADPGRRHELRYLDGQRWTEHVSDRGTQRLDPM
jgi:hypothetical protein